MFFLPKFPWGKLFLAWSIVIGLCVIYFLLVYVSNSYCFKHWCKLKLLSSDENNDTYFCPKCREEQCKKQV